MDVRKGSIDEEIIDVDSLKSFTIPKRKKSKQELFELVSLHSREFIHELCPLFEKNIKEKDGSKNFRYLGARLVHNEEILNAYSERRKEMRQDGYSEKEVQDSYAFLHVDSEYQMKKICEEGLHVGNISTSVLGNPAMAVCLSKHPDFARSVPPFPNMQGFIIIFRFMKGRVKVMVENPGGEPLDPTPNFDCHVSKQAHNVEPSWTHQQTHASTQYYIYEYGDFDLAKKPRQVCPYAAIFYKYVGEVKASPRPPSKVTSMKIGNRPSVMNQSLSSNNHWPIPNAIPKHPLQPPGLDSRYDPRLSRQVGRSTSDIPSQQSVPGQDDLCTASRLTRPVSIDDPDVVTTLGLKSPSLDKSSQSQESVDPTSVLVVPERVTRVGSVGMEIDGNGIVVWSGAVLNKEFKICVVDLIMFGNAIKPARFGPSITLGKRIALQTANMRYFSGLSNLPKSGEIFHEGRYYSYGEFRPGEMQAKFCQLMNYLTKKSSVVLVQLEDNVDFLLLVNSEITQNLGLSLPGIHSNVMYCIFVAPRSRQASLSVKERRVSSNRSVGTPSPHPIPSPVPSPASLIRFTPPINTPSPSPGCGVPAHKAPLLNRDSITQAFMGQAEQAVYVPHETGPPSVGSQHSIDSWSLPPSPNLFSNPSPAGLPHNVDDLHLSTQFDQTSSSIQGDDTCGSATDFDGGYKRFVPVDSLVYKRNLMRAFTEQSVVQDRRNIDLARGKMFAGMGPPPMQPVKRTANGSPLLIRKRTASQDSNSFDGLSPMVSNSSSLSSQADMNGMVSTPPTPGRVPFILGPHGQIIEPISPAGSSSNTTTNHPSPNSPYVNMEPTDPLDQLQQQLHQKMSPIRFDVDPKGSPDCLRHTMHRSMSPMKSLSVLSSQYGSRSSSSSYSGLSLSDVSQHSPKPILSQHQPSGSQTSGMSAANHSSRCVYNIPAALQVNNLPPALHPHSPMMPLSPHFHPSPHSSQMSQHSAQVIGQQFQNSPGTPSSTVYTDTGQRTISDPRMVRHSLESSVNSAMMHLSGGGILQADVYAGNPSILQNILTSQAQKSALTFRDDLMTNVETSLPGSIEQLIARTPQPSQANVTTRDPRFNSSATLNHAAFPLDASQNLSKSLSVGTIPSMPCTVAGGGSLSNTALPPISGTNTHRTLSQLHHPAGPITCTSSTTSSSTVCSTQTPPSTGILPCQTERLPADDGCRGNRTAPVSRQGVETYDNASDTVDEDNRGGTPYDPSDVVGGSPIDDVSDDDDDDDSNHYLSLSDVSSLKDDFYDIIHNPKRSSMSDDAQTADEPDMNLSDDLVNLIVRSQPLAAKAARELKEQIRGLEEQARQVEEQDRLVESQIIDNKQNCELSACSPSVPDEDSHLVKNISSSQIRDIDIWPVIADVNASKEMQFPAKKICLDKTSSETSECGNKNIFDVHPVPMKLLPRIPKIRSESDNTEAKMGDSDETRENPDGAIPSSPVVAAKEVQLDIKLIPVDVVAEKLVKEADESGLISHQQKELDYFNHIYEGSSNEDLLNLGLDYVSVRFIGGAKVQWLPDSKELHVVKELKSMERPKTTDKLPSEESSLKDAVNKILHLRNKPVIEETAEERDRVLLWHIGLHYLLPLIEAPDEDSREILDDSQKKIHRGDTVSSQQESGSKSTSSVNSRHDRYHPYRRVSHTKEDEAEKEEIFKVYRSYRDLEDLMKCLTSRNFKSRQTRPLHNIFTGPFSRRDSAPRFRGLQLKRHTMDDLIKLRHDKLRGDDDEDRTYTCDEIADYERRKEISKTINTHYLNERSDQEIYVSQYEAEKKVYGEDENKNQTGEGEGAVKMTSSPTRVSNIISPR